MFSFWGKKNATGPAGKTGVIPLEMLKKEVVLRDPPEACAILISVIRQSGLVEREMSAPSSTAALEYLENMFLRMREPSVRIWQNKENFLELHRPYGSFRGKAEGKKISGATLAFISLPDLKRN